MTNLTQTPNLDLPYILAGQAQKHVTHNEAIRALDALVHLAVISADITTPPDDAAEGDRYLVPENANGDWADQAQNVAAWQDGGWLYYTAQAGWVAFDLSSQNFRAFMEGAWISISSAGGDAGNSVVDPTILGVNTDADSTNRLAVASEAVLFTHDSDDLRLTLNKEAAGDTVSVTLQTNFEGHGEIGLTGDNNLHFKVSPNGTNWLDAMVINHQNGNIGIGAAPTDKLAIAGGYVRMGYHQLSAFENIGGAAMEIMRYASGDRPAYFDFHGCDEWTDYSSRFIRYGGQNANFQISNRGTGAIQLLCEGAGRIVMMTNMQNRLVVNETGRVGVGTLSPTTKMDVRGGLRVGNYNMSSRPSASASGAGTIIFVFDRPGGAGLMVSNGSTWINT